MKLKIHTVGASGSGTTTLAKALANHLKISHFDADSYYWEPTDPQFTVKRPPELRVELLRKDLDREQSWVLSGSLVKWGESLQDRFTNVVFISLPSEIRIARLKKREFERFGERIELGGDMHQQHLDFIEWAKKYDEGGLEVRSRKLHEAWFKTLKCPLTRVSGEISTDQQVASVISSLQ